MISEKQISDWKSEFGKIFKTVNAGKPVIYRLLTRTDYLGIVQDQQVAASTGTPFDPELETFRTCVLNSIDFSEEDLIMCGGTVTSVYEQIMSKSGFVTAESEEL